MDCVTEVTFVRVGALRRGSSPALLAGLGIVLDYRRRPAMALVLLAIRVPRGRYRPKVNLVEKCTITVHWAVANAETYHWDITRREAPNSRDTAKVRVNLDTTVSEV